VLKKAGIVVATAAAALMAVSPLAFAGDKGDDHGHHGHSKEVNANGAEKNSEGLINVSNNNLSVPVQACNNDVPVNVLGIQVSDVQADLTGALGLLGGAEADREGQTGDERECAQASDAGDSVEQGIDD
jgi:hypothetical protein